MSEEKCFCHLGGYAVKDATARKKIETIEGVRNSGAFFPTTTEEFNSLVNDDSNIGKLIVFEDVTYEIRRWNATNNIAVQLGGGGSGGTTLIKVSGIGTSVNDSAVMKLIAKMIDECKGRLTFNFSLYPGYPVSFSKYESTYTFDYCISGTCLEKIGSYYDVHTFTYKFSVSKSNGRPTFSYCVRTSYNTNSNAISTMDYANNIEWDYWNDSEITL